MKVKLFKSPNLQTTSLDFDDSGELLLTSRTDDTLQIYNVKAGAAAKELKSQKYGCTLARFTHQSQSIIYASTKVDNDLRYLATHDNSYIRYFKGHTDRVTALALCPGNDTFLSAAKDNTVRLWDLRSPSAQGQLNLAGPMLVAYDPSANVMAIASPMSQTALLYDVRNFDKAPFATFDLKEMEDRYNPRVKVEDRNWTSLELSNNGKSLLVGTNGQGHYLLDAFEGNLQGYLLRPAGPPDSTDRKQLICQGDACFSPCGRYVISASGAPGLVVFDSQGPDQGQKVMTPVSDLPGPKTVNVVGYNPRYNVIATAASEITLWLPDPELL